MIVWLPTPWHNVKDDIGKPVGSVGTVAHLYFTVADVSL